MVRMEINMGPVQVWEKANFGWISNLSVWIGHGSLKEQASKITNITGKVIGKIYSQVDGHKSV